MDALLLTLDMIAVVVFGLWGAKYMEQKTRDKRYKPTSILTLPAQGVTADQADDFFRTVHGLVSTSKQLRSVPTIVFELWASGGTKTPRIKVPANLEEDILSQLHSAIPGMRVDPDETPPQRVWTCMQELGMRNKHRGLQPESAASASRRVTAAFNAVGETETLLMQWVITGAGRQELPAQKEAERSKFSIFGAINGNKANADEVTDRRKKESEPNLKGVLRIAAQADTRQRAARLVGRVRNALAPTGTAYTYFEPRLLLSGRTLEDRVSIAAGSTSWPVKLTVSEFVRVCGWQIDAEPGVGFAPGRSMDLPPHAGVAREGIVLGTATYPGQNRPVAISYKAVTKHVQVLGRTGCLHPDTPVFDPTDGTEKTVKERWSAGKPFHVFSMHGGTLVVAKTEAPLRYRRVPMFALCSENSRVVVTGQHKVWNGQSYVEVQTLVGGVFRLPSISESGLSRLREDAQHSNCTAQGSPHGRHQVYRSCDEPPPLASACGQAKTPSLTDAAGPGSSGHVQGGQESRPERSRPYRLLDRLAMRGLQNRESHVLLSGCRAPSSTSSQPCVSPGASPGWRSDSCQTGTTRLSDRSPRPSSSYPRSGLLFNNYFNDTTFWVEPAGCETYYDFHVPVYENYLACGLIHHNTGKSVLISNSARQAMRDGHGLILMEKAGDLMNMVLDYVTPERYKDVIVFDMSDTERPIGFNILDQGNRNEAVDGVMELIAHRMGRDGDMGPWTRKGLKLALQTIADTPGLSIIDILALINPMTDDERDWSRSVVAKVQDPELKRQWTEWNNRDDRNRRARAEPVETRMAEFSTSRELRYVIGQSTSAFTWKDVLEGNKILLISFKGVPKDAVGMACGMFMQSLWGAIKAQGAKQSDKLTFVMLDESKEFVDLPVDLETMFEQGRKFGVSFWVANQQLSQLKPTSLEEAVLNNTLTKIVFQTFAKDAAALRRETGVNDENFKRLPEHEAIVHTLTSTGATVPVTIRALAPKPEYVVGNGAALRKQSRELYGTPLTEVQHQIIDRRRPPEDTSRGTPPPIPSDWDL